MLKVENVGQGDMIARNDFSDLVFHVAKERSVRDEVTIVSLDKLDSGCGIEDPFVSVITKDEITLHNRWERV